MIIFKHLESSRWCICYTLIYITYVSIQDYTDFRIFISAYAETFCKLWVSIIFNAKTEVVLFIGITIVCLRGGSRSAVCWKIYITYNRNHFSAAVRDRVVSTNDLEFTITNACCHSEPTQEVYIIWYPSYTPPVTNHSSMMASLDISNVAKMKNTERNTPNHTQQRFYNISCIGGCLVAQNTVAEIWFKAW